MSPFQIRDREIFCEDFREDSKVYLIESQTSVAAVDCCAEKLKRDLKLKGGNSRDARQSSDSRDARNGKVENGDHHGEEKEEEDVKESASQCNGGDSDGNRATSQSGKKARKYIVELH